MIMEQPAPKRVRATDLFEQDRIARIEKLRLDIGCRLGKACSHLPPEEFKLLIENMIRVQLAGEGRAR